MTTRLENRKAGLAARLAFVFAALLGAAAVHAEPEHPPETVPEAAAAESEPAAVSGNSLDESGVFAVRPKRGVVIDEADFNSTTP